MTFELLMAMQAVTPETVVVTWPLVAVKLIDNLPAIIAALASVIAAIGGCMAFVQSRKNATTQKDGNQAVAALAVQTAKDVATVVKDRADSQDVKLDQIHEATNGGVQALRDKAIVDQDRILALEVLLKQALAANRGGS